jgi:ADP-ribose pyrophosphatase YjhB (NUDIX family)
MIENGLPFILVAWGVTVMFFVIRCLFYSDEVDNLKKQLESKKDFIFYPLALSTVDMAVTRERYGVIEILLGKKENDLLWRLPGGFVDVELDCSREEAATRELFEECKIHLQFTVDNYLGSFKVDDKRYRKSKDKIFTSLYQYHLSKDEDVVPAAGDDLVDVRWMTLNKELNLQVVPNHRILISQIITNK